MPFSSLYLHNIRLPLMIIITLQQKTNVKFSIQGTKLQACAFGDDILMLDRLLQLFDTYVIHVPRAKKANNQLPNYNQTVQVILNSRSSIRPVTTNLIAQTVGKPTFETFSEIPSHIPGNTYMGDFFYIQNYGYKHLCSFSILTYNSCIFRYNWNSY